MTAPKMYERYTTEWLALFDTMNDDPLKVHVLYCPTEKRAHGIRSEFYKARTAFLQDPDMKAEYANVLNSREVLIRGTDVVFEHKDNNWAGQIIRASLQKEKEQQDETSEDRGA